MEKLETNSSDVNIGYAVVLLTPDDIGKLATDSCEPSPRARQNVVFELGYFISKLGRERVSALIQGEIELPTDYGGVVYIPFDTPGAWKLSLATELASLDFNINLNELIKKSDK